MPEIVVVVYLPRGELLKALLVVRVVRIVLRHARNA